MAISLSAVNAIIQPAHVQAGVLAREHLGVDEQREALVEREREGVRGLILLEPGRSEDAKAHRLKLLEGRFSHRHSFIPSFLIIRHRGQW
ncbi:MAG: hypothetical protein U0270_20045 [Labilithrix sp.]